MKYRMLILAALLLCCLTACAEEDSTPATEQTQGSLLLVDTRPDEAQTLPPEPESSTVPTLPETTPAETETVPPAPAQPQIQPTQAGAAPVITKQPTPETVNAGEEAWFVARADDASTVSWLFLEDGMPQEPEHVASIFPDMKVETRNNDTLILKNIPYGINGWTVQAEFGNEFGTVSTDPVLLTVKNPVSAEPGDLPAAYGPVIENCRFIQYFDYYTDSADQLSQRDPYNLYAGKDLVEGNLGYALRDLDGNGTPELLLGCTGANSFGDRGGEILFAMFTLRDGAPVKVLQSRSRNRHYLSADNQIYYEGVSDTSTGIFTILRLEGSRLVPCRDLWTQGTDANGQTLAFYSPTGAKDETSVQRIGDERFYELQAEMIASREPLPALSDII